MQTIIAKLNKNKLVESIIQFGSSLDKKDYRDIDLCLFTVTPLSLKEKLMLLRDIPKMYDISFYEDLPLHIKREVLAKGKVLFTKNYYRILQQVQYVDLEYPRYKEFLEDYHREVAEAL
jgi:hypothetical protein